MNIGYARTSTADQLAGFEAQLKELADIQRKVKDLVKDGVSKAEVSRQLNIGEASVYRILKR